MSGWLHALLLADGVNFSNVPSSGPIIASGPNTAAQLTVQSTTPGDGKIIVQAFGAGQGVIEFLGVGGAAQWEIYNDGLGNLFVGTAVSGVGSLVFGNLPAGGLGFFGAGPTPQVTITGAKAGNTALASLLTQLAAYGLLIDSTT